MWPRRACGGSASPGTGTSRPGRSGAPSQSFLRLADRVPPGSLPIGADRRHGPDRRQIRTCSNLAVVDFDDTPDEAAFRAEARAWLDAHAPGEGFPGGLLDRLPRGHDVRRGPHPSPEGVAADAVRPRLGRHHLARGVRRPGRHADAVGDLHPGAQPLRGVRGCVLGGDRHGRADDHAPRHRRAEGAVPAADAAGRRAVVPAVLRARRGFGPGRHRHPGGARRRRVGGDGSEGVDVDGDRRASGGSCWPAPIRTRRSTRASRTSWSTWRRRGSTSGRSAR